ncbi:MAG: AAA family ATPase [Candidatus Bathyarchaeia archaeon]
MRVPLIIGVFGKGGVGKTTFTALLLKALIERRKELETKLGKTPTILAVDADPNTCLPAALGVKKFTTLDHLTEEFKGKSIDPELFQSRFQNLMLENEQEDYDLLVMGRGESGGCYCYINYLLKHAVEKYVLKGDYAYDFILMDCEAGLEQISRKTASWVDNLVILTDPSETSLKTLERIKKTLSELSLKEGIPVGRVFILGNLAREFPKGSYPFIEEKIRSHTKSIGAEYLGTLPYEAKIQELNLAGRPVVELPREVEFYRKIEEVLEKLIAAATKKDRPNS